MHWKRWRKHGEAEWIRPDRTGERFWAKVDTSGGMFACWPWLGAVDPKGYGRFRGLDGGTVGAHRFALELALGRPLASGMQACHTCDNPPCCNPVHLLEGTVTDNNQDMARKGRHFSRTRPDLIVRGEHHGQARLTASEVAELRTLYATGRHTLVALGQRFGISDVHAGRIARGLNWRAVSCA